MGEAGYAIRALVFRVFFCEQKKEKKKKEEKLELVRLVDRF